MDWKSYDERTHRGAAEMSLALTYDNTKERPRVKDYSNSHVE